VVLKRADVGDLKQAVELAVRQFAVKP
jgi:hypothetical protein